MNKRLLVLVLSVLCVWTPAASDPVPRTINGKLIDAVKYMQFGMSAEATKLLEEIIAQDPGNDAAHYYLGNCKLYSNDIQGAVACYNKAASLDSLNVSYQRILASLYTNIGNEKAAADIYNRLRKDNPAMYSDPVTLTVLGDVAFDDLDDDTLALNYFQTALEQSPDYVPALLGAADVYRFRRDMPEFFGLLNQFVSNPRIRSDAKCQYVRGMLEQIDASTYRNWLPNLDSLVTGCIGAHPGDSNAIKLACSWFFGTERLEKGKEYVNELVELYPTDISANYIKMESDLRMMDYEGAIRDCSAMLELPDLQAGDRIGILNVLGDCCYQTGRVQEAYSWYEKALKIDGNYAPVLNNYAYFLSLEGKQLRKALKMSRITVNAEPNNPTYLDTYGWILFKLCKFAEAKPYFKHALLYGGMESREILEHYSLVLKALGEDSLSDYYRNLAKDK